MIVNAKKGMVQLLSYVSFHPHALHSLSTDSFTLDSFCRRRESDVPLPKTVVLPPTVEGDDPVTFTPDVLTHRPHHGVTGSGTQKCHTVLQLHPATVKNKH